MRMPEPSQLIAFVVAATLLGITPGPDIIYVITRGATQGPRPAIAAAAGLTTGVIGHTALTVVGISAILAASATAFTVVKLAGAAYLIYLGIRAWRSGPLSFADADGGKAVGAIYRQTIIMNLLNPKVALFFLAFLPQFVNPAAGPVGPQLALLGALFMAVAFVVMSSAGLIGAQLRGLLVRSRHAARAANKVAGSVFIVLGIGVALQNRT